MNRLNYLLTGLLIAVLGITSSSCEDDALKGIVTYSVVRPNAYNSNADGELNFSDIFNVSVTYKSASGKMITENNISLPWSVKQEVEAPFTASIDVDITLKTLEKAPLEFPRPNSGGNLAQITITSEGKKLQEGNPVTGTGGGLYSTIDTWITQNGHTSRTLTFTEETLEKNGAIN